MNGILSYLKRQRPGDLGVGLVLSLVLFSVSVASGQDDVRRISYGILLDNTGSMRQQITKQQEIARAIVSESQNKATVSIFGFAPTGAVVSVATGLECSVDSEKLSKQIGEIGVVAGKTTLFDGVRSAVDRLGNPVAKACGESDEKILVVLSDGEDVASTETAEDLYKFIRQTGVKIYVVSLIQALSPSSGFITKSSPKKSKEFLRRLASESGGRIVFPGKKETPREIVVRLFSSDYTPPK